MGANLIVDGPTRTSRTERASYLDASALATTLNMNLFDAFCVCFYLCMCVWHHLSIQWTYNSAIIPFCKYTLHCATTRQITLVTEKKLNKKNRHLLSISIQMCIHSDPINISEQRSAARLSSLYVWGFRIFSLSIEYANQGITTHHLMGLTDIHISPESESPQT